jgi:hypothetical protein
MGDFRPIACCNILYKCITKILSNRMVAILDSVVSRAQSAFIPGRSISFWPKNWSGTIIGKMVNLDAQ